MSIESTPEAPPAPPVEAEQQPATPRHPLGHIPIVFAFRVERVQELLLVPGAPSDARVLRLAMTKTSVLKLAHDLLELLAQMPTETADQLMMTTVSIPGFLMKENPAVPAPPLPFRVPGVRG